MANLFMRNSLRNNAPPSTETPKLAESTLSLVVSSLPTFKANSKEIAIEMYRRIFHVAPSLKSLFSLDFLSVRSKSSSCPMSHHKLDIEISAQAQILADSILSFCANVNNMEAFNPVLTRICSKHVSRSVQAEHYVVVAKCFSEAVQQVIGDKISEEERGAWDKAVLFLADKLIKREKEIYERLETSAGAWKGFRSFQVSKINPVQNTSGISVVLTPKDHEKVAEFVSGQYVCLRAQTPEYGPVHRNIPLCPITESSLSSESPLSSYEVQLTIPAKKNDVDCLVNTDAVVFQHMKGGGEIQISAPVGGFVQHAKFAKSRATGGSYLRAGLAGKSALRDVSRVVALQGARSPLAVAVQGNLEDGISNPRIRRAGKPSEMRPSPLHRFQE